MMRSTVRRDSMGIGPKNPLPTDHYLAWLEDIAEWRDTQHCCLLPWEANEFLETVLDELPVTLTERQKGIIVWMARKYLREEMQ